MSDELIIPQGLWTGDYYNEGTGKDDIFDTLKEECGVFGVFNHPEAASLSYYGLHALQHRGKKAQAYAFRMVKILIITVVWDSLRKYLIEISCCH